MGGQDQLLIAMLRPLRNETRAEQSLIHAFVDRSGPISWYGRSTLAT